MRSYRGAAIGAVAIPLLDLLVGIGFNQLAATEQSRLVALYSLGSLPLAAIIGGIGGGRLASLRPRIGSKAIGVLACLVGALSVAAVQSFLRLRYLGAGSGFSLVTLPYAEEVAMLIGLGPALFCLGAAAASWREQSTGAVIVAAVLGAGVAILVGPTLIVTAALGAVGIGPLVVGAIAVGIVIAIAAIRSRQAGA